MRDNSDAGETGGGFIAIEDNKRGSKNERKWKRVNGADT
jgi:hypothetical protein